LFPGLLSELVADGCHVSADGDASRFYMSFGGHQVIRSGTFPHFEPRLAGYFGSRPFLEAHVRQRVRAIPNVTVMDGHDLVELTCNTERSRVAGVIVTSRQSDEKHTLSADLVVDVTGRGSRTPAFLESFGYDRPVEDEVVVRLAYASQMLRIPPGMYNELLA